MKLKFGTYFSCTSLAFPLLSPPIFSFSFPYFVHSCCPFFPQFASFPFFPPFLSTSYLSFSFFSSFLFSPYLPLPFPFLPIFSPALPSSSIPSHSPTLPSYSFSYTLSYFFLPVPSLSIPSLYPLLPFLGVRWVQYITLSVLQRLGVA